MIIDFGRSFITWRTKDDSFGRFNIESILNVSSFDGRLIDSIITTSSVIACDVYGDYPLFKSPPYLYQSIISNQSIKIFRTHQIDKNCDTVEPINKYFKEIKTNIIAVKNSKLLKNNLQISDAVFNNKTIVGNCLLKSNNLSYEIIFPVKHINISLVKDAFQIETGVIGFVENGHFEEYYKHEIFPVYIALSNFNKISMIFNKVSNINFYQNSRFFKDVRIFNCNSSIYSF
jgi:hypothetical protein